MIVQRLRLSVKKLSRGLVILVVADAVYDGSRGFVYFTIIIRILILKFQLFSGHTLPLSKGCHFKGYLTFNNLKLID